MFWQKDANRISRELAEIQAADAEHLSPWRAFGIWLERELLPVIWPFVIALLAIVVFLAIFQVITAVIAVASLI